jgi:tetratricopeptide (TPR) repeat protein
MRAAVCPLISVLVIGLAEPAFADAKSRAKELFESAEKSFRLGRFEDALASYAAAYERLPLPEFLFNMAQCHRNMGNYERAIFFLESYLTEEQRPSDRASVEALIAELSHRLEQQRALEAKLQAAPRVTTATVTIPIFVSSDPDDVPLYERGWFWGTLIASVVAVGGAIAIGIVASNDGIPEGQFRFDYTR